MSCPECGGSGSVHVAAGLNSYSRRCSRGCETNIERGSRLLEAERKAKRRSELERARAEGYRQGLERAAEIAEADLLAAPGRVEAVRRFDGGSSELAARRIAAALRAELEKKP
jgi:hypothetical protein